jgi:rhodanese-related sulfurtransferase
MTQPVDPGAAPTVEPTEAERRLREGAGDPGGPLVVDVREPVELIAARIDGAVFLPMSEFQSRFRELPTDRPLLVVCQSGYRSGLAASFLVGNGYRDAVNVTGGMTAWERAGLPVRRGPLAPEEGLSGG